MDEHNTMVRQWVAMNRPLQKPSSASSPREVDVDISDDDQSIWASRHREAILDTATKFAASWKRPPRKRKAATETVIPKKKAKLQSRKPPVSVALVANKHTNKNPCKTLRSVAKKPKVVNTLIKQYLQPTKMSKLNQPVKTHPTAEKSFPVVNRLSNSGEAGSDRDASKPHQSSVENNAKLEEKTQGCITGNAEQANILLANKKRSIEHIPVDMENYDEFLNDEDLLDIDLSTLTNSTQTTGMSIQPCTPQACPVSIYTGCLSSSSPFQSKIPYPCSIKTQPFLRQILPETTSPTKYSSIPRLTLFLRVPTCFRIAEAIRLLKPPITSTQTAPVTTIELFAAVTSVSANETNTAVQFADVFFPHQPPYITGTIASTKQLYLASSTIYRAIIRASSTSNRRIVLNDSTTSRNSSGSQHLAIHHVQVESITLSSMAEIEHVRGIVDPEGVELEKQKRGEMAKGAAAKPGEVMDVDM